MATRHESLRIEETTAEAVMNLAEANESKAAVYNRVLKAGLQALERGESEAIEQESAERYRETLEADTQALRDTIDSLRGYIADFEGKNRASENEIQTLKDNISDLKDYISTLKGQLDIKDEQISNLNMLTSQAQQLHALTETKALESTEAKERRIEESEEPEKEGGFFSWLFGRK